MGVPFGPLEDAPLSDAPLSDAPLGSGFFISDIRAQESLSDEYDQRLRRAEALSRQFSELDAQNLELIHQAYPNISMELAEALVLAQVPASDPNLEALAQREALHDQSILDRAYSAIKGGTRLAFTAFDAVWEEAVARNFRAAAADIYDAEGAENLNFFQIREQLAGESIGLRALNEARQGNRVNLGSGFFPSSEQAEGSRQFELFTGQGFSPDDALALSSKNLGRPITQEFLQESEQLKLNGVPISPGRVFAGQVLNLEPGTRPFSIVSGGVDLGSQVAFDPISKAMKFTKTVSQGLGTVQGASDIGKIGRFQGRGALRTGPVLGPDGLVARGLYRSGVLPKTGEDLLRTQRGQRLVRAVRDETEDIDFLASRLGINDRRYLQELLEAGTDAEVSHLLLTGTRPGAIPSIHVPGAGTGTLLGQTGPTPAGLGRNIGTRRNPLPGLGPNPSSWIGAKHLPGDIARKRWKMKRNPYWGRRAFKNQHGVDLDPEDLDTGFTDMQTFLFNSNVPTAKRNEILSRFAKLEDGDLIGLEDVTADALQEWVNVMGGEFDRPSKVLDKMIPAWAREQTRAKLLVDHSGDPIQHLGRNTIDIAGTTEDIVQMPLEAAFASRTVTLPDPNEVRRLVSPAFKMFDGINEMAKAIPGIPALRKSAVEQGAIANMMDGLMGGWKSLVLLRAAWTVRVVGEEQVRMGVTGLDSMFNHPLSYIAWRIGRSDEKGLISRAVGADGLDEFATKFGKGRRDIAGNFFDESFRHQRSMSQKGALFRGSRTGTTSPDFHNVIKRGEDGYVNAWARELLILNRDPLSRQYLSGQSRGQIKTWMKSTPEGQAHVRRLVGGNRGLRKASQEPDFVDWYVDNTVAKLEKSLGGDLAWRESVDEISGRTATPAGTRPAGADDLAVGTVLDLEFEGVQRRGTVQGVASHGRRNPRTRRKETVFRVELDDGTRTEAFFSDIQNLSPSFRGQTIAVPGQAAVPGTPGVPEGWNFQQMTMGDTTLRGLLTGDETIGAAAGITDFDQWESAISPGYQKLLDVLTEKAAAGIGPGAVEGNSRPFGRLIGRAGGSDAADGVVEDLFKVFMGRRTDNLSRSPAFRQFYAEEMAQLATFGDDATVQKMAKWMTDNNIGIEWLDRIKAWGNKVTGVDSSSSDEALKRLMTHVRSSYKGKAAITSIEDMDMLAKAKALDETRKLLYDLTRRSNIAELTRNIFPFGEAWIEIMGTWARLNKENFGLPARRLQQMVEGSRESGFFTQDENGREVFVYPGQGLLTNWMFGGKDKETGEEFGSELAQTQLVGNVQGLNIVSGSIIPGFGPAIQVAVNAFAKNQPNVEWLREIVTPFGEKPLESFGDVAEFALPSWMKRTLTAAGFDTELARSHSQSTMQIMGQLLREEGGGIDLPRNRYDQLLSRASDIATRLAWVRAIGSFAAPTSPTPRHLLASGQDERGNYFWWDTQTLASEFREKREKVFDNDSALAFDWFVKQYGFDPFLLSTPKTARIITTTGTAEGSEFRRQNALFFDKFPNVAYFINPDTPDTFDPGSIQRAIDDGARVGLSPEQWMMMRNQTLARNIYNNVARKFEGHDTNKAVRRYLRDVNIYLQNTYNGYTPFDPFAGIPGVPEQVAPSVQIQNFYQMLDDPQFSNLDTSPEAVKGISLYLQQRDRMIEALQGAGLTANREGTFSRADRAAPTRAHLRNVAERLITLYPDFRAVWDQVFKRELVEDESELDREIRIQGLLQTEDARRLLLFPSGKTVSRDLRQASFSRSDQPTFTPPNTLSVGN